jgi:membrane protease YdiL (CAAX protease family)
VDEYQNVSPIPLPGELPPGVASPAPPAPRQNNIFVGPHGLRAGWRALIFVLLFAFFVIVLGTTIILLRHGNKGKISGLSPGVAIFQDGILLVALLLTHLVIKLFEKRPIGSYGLPLRRALRGTFWRGAALGFVALTGLLLAIRALHGFYFGHVALSGPTLWRYVLLWAVAFFLVGIFEEYSVRGYLQYVLTRGIGFWPAAIVTSLIFGLLHVGNPGESVVGLVSVVAVGLFFCLILRRTGDLWFAVGFHMAWDYAQTFVYGVADSGLPSVGHLFDSHFQQGPKWLTGGTVGPEASWLVFPTLGVAALLVAWLYPEAKYPEPEPAPATANAVMAVTQ